MYSAKTYHTEMIEVNRRLVNTYNNLLGTLKEGRTLFLFKKDLRKKYDDAILAIMAELETTRKELNAQNSKEKN